MRERLAWAKDHVFDGIVLLAILLTQADIWTNVDEDRYGLAAVALVTAAVLLFRRRAPLAAPLVVAAGGLVLTLLDATAAYETDTMFLVLILAAWAAGALLDPRHAALAIAAVLATGWAVFIRAPDVPWTELLWLSFPILGLFVISAAAARHSERARLAEERARRSE